MYTIHTNIFAGRRSKLFTIDGCFASVIVELRDLQNILLGINHFVTEIGNFLDYFKYSKNIL